MLATAEQEVAALQARFGPAVQASLREAVDATRLTVARPMRYHLGWEDAQGRPDSGGGKALRPVLCLMACELAGGQAEQAMPAAAALELIHNFTLIHDDIQDGDATRRGRPTTWNVFGTPQAVAVGNGMRAIADATLLAGAGLAPALAARASAELTARTLEVIEGQYLDLSFESERRVSVHSYLDMVGRKTGALVQAAMYLGALAATGDTATAGALGACGRRLGLAFQVRDDWLGVWGDPSLTGKAVGADIRRKKQSLPVLTLFARASATERTWLEGAYGADEVSGPALERVMALLERHQVPTAVQAEAEAQAAGALEAVATLGLAPEARRKLEAMAEFFVTRLK
ncbi:MAG: polyprenyl synthetase family protein [Chloroflexota bacterium]